MRLTHLSALILLASCSVHVDSQYGLRLRPADRRAPSSEAPAAEPRENTSWTSVEALNLDAKYLSGTPSASASLDMERTPSLPDEDAGGAKSGAESGAEPIPQPVTDAPREVGRVAFMDTQVPLADEVELAAAAPQKNMLRAWIMWGVPVFLMLFGIGFVLNIGVHWYYLGKNRRAQSATRIWSLTLVSFVALGLLSALGMEVLAGVLFVFLVIPLAAIQLIRAVKDASLLHKMSKQSARKDRRGSGSIV